MYTNPLSYLPVDQVVVLKSVLPIPIGEWAFSNKEYMQYLYMPIKMRNSGKVRYEPRLHFLKNMIDSCIETENHFYSVKEIHNKYIYLTVKQSFVPKGSDHNRPGWHSDGFGTADSQYVWCDKWPTEFIKGNVAVRNDDSLSMEDMEAWGVTYPESIIPAKSGLLYRIDQHHIHRPVPAPESGVRLFFKLTFSDHRYAQQGNSINYEMQRYNWNMAPRSIDRNQPHQTNP